MARHDAHLSHRSDIQGLRAVAVLLVALAHAGVGFLQGGFVGVDVFFVLSGFLITGLLVSRAEETGSISLVDFYVRRARRILPAAALTLVTTQLAGFFLLNFVRAREIAWDTVFATVFAANVHFAQQGTNYFARAQRPSPMLHFWSLSVEEQFYLVWPALISLGLFGFASMGPLRRPARARLRLRRLLIVLITVAVASLLWSMHETRVLPADAYFSAFARGWELALGALLAAGWSRRARLPGLWRVVMGWSGLLAVLGAAVCFSGTTPFPGYAALLPTVGAVLVICAGIGDGQPRLSVGRMLALPPLRFLGDRSYAFYLWHWPVLVIAVEYVGHELSVGLKLVLLTGAFALSIITYGAFENPIRRANWRVSRSSAAFTAMAAVVLLAAAFSLNAIDKEEARFNSRAGWSHAGVGLMSSTAANRAHRPRIETVAVTDVGRPLPAVVAAVRAAERGAPLPTGLAPPIGELRTEVPPFSLPRGCVPVAVSSESTSKICRVGDTSSSKLIVLLGDSHAQMWMPAVLRLAARDGWAVIPLLRPGCTPDTWIDDHGLAACRPWYRWALRQARSLHPDVALIGGALSGSPWRPRETTHGMISMARAVKTSARRVVVIGDAEGLKRDPVDCLLARHASMALCTTTWARTRLKPYDDVAKSAAADGYGFMDTRLWFCFAQRCPTVIGHTIAYRDNHHITAAYALALTGPFRAEFRRAVRRTP